MTDREALLWEAQRHLDQRPIRRRESAPAAWLVLVTGVIIAAVGIVAGYWVWVK